MLLVLAGLSVAAPVVKSALADEAGCHPDAAATLPDFLDPQTQLTRAGCNADVAVYLDDGLRARASETAWILPYVTDVWRYLKQTYGGCAVPRTIRPPMGPGCESFGAPKPLIVLLREHRSGPQVGYSIPRFWSPYRNEIRITIDDWSDRHLMRDLLTHEACHQVEFGGQGVNQSPAYRIWGDSMWIPLCTYDFYVNTGRTANADAEFDESSNGVDNLPQGAVGAHWFRDWFFPMWRDNGGSKILDRFFRLLSMYYPTAPENNGTNLVYSRPAGMNTGEFVHFFSGAAGVDLSGQAAFAFNSGFNRADFEKAKADFPGITYAPAPCVSGSVPCLPIRVSYPGRQRFLRVGNPPVRIAADTPATGGPLRYSASGLPEGVSIDPGSGVIGGTPTGPGHGMATITVSGAQNNTGKTSFNWDIFDRYGQITSSSGQCVDDRAGITDNGNPVQSWPCGAQPGQAQGWTINGQRISARGKCLSTAKNGDTADGTGVVLWDCDGSAAQQWRIDPVRGTITNVAANKCLTPPSDWVQITISACTTSTKQQWKLPQQSVTVNPPGAQTAFAGKAASLQIQARTTTPGAALTYAATGLPPGLSLNPSTGSITGTPTTRGSYTVTVTVTQSHTDATQTTFAWSIVDGIGDITAADGKCIDVTGSQTANGSSVQTWGCASPAGASQNWTVNGQQLSAMGKCLSTANNGDTAERTGVVLWDCDGSAAQQWRIDPVRGTITNVAANKCLTAPGSLAQITISACTGAPLQHWKLPG